MNLGWNHGQDSPYAAGAWPEATGMAQPKLRDIDTPMQVCERRHTEHFRGKLHPVWGQVTGACLWQELLVDGFYSIVQ